ncbi:MAG: ester cyclase [Candidatus Kariarchaeaceae archaeon]
MSYRNLAIQYFKDVLEDGNLTILEDIIHPEYSSEEYYGKQELSGPGIEKFKKRIKIWRNSFSEKYLLKHVMEDSDAVFCEYVVTTKQKRPWFGKIPKEKTAIVEGFMLFKIKQNKIFSSKERFDYNDLWSQLGYLVDIGEFQLPGHLSTDISLGKVDLDHKKVNTLESDFSILQSSAHQYKDLLQYASYVQRFLNISDKAIRAITLSSVIEWQTEFKSHQSDLTGSLPQELMMNTIWILERGKEKIKDMLLFEADAEKLDLIFQSLIDFFAKEYSK